MGTSRPASERKARWIVAKQVGQFTLAGLAAAAIVAFATAIASRRVGEREAIVDARSTTLLKARGLVAPVLTDGLSQEDPAAVRAIATVVERDVLDDSLVRVKIWRSDGTIVYSDEARLIGTKYVLGEDEQAAIADGLIAAEVSDLSKPENRFERDNRKMLEVYLPIEAPNGERLLFEAYFRYAAVSASGTRVWRNFAPITLGGLLALQLVQIPLAWSLARRLRQRQREREGLLQKALEASDVERRRIASDLHDGVVQDLVGVAFALGGAARRSDISAESAQLLEHSAEDVRVSIKALRSLLVEIYPPNLFEEGLVAALTDLLARTNGQGISAELHVDELTGTLPPAVTGLLYRAAQEALRNVLKHANATSVSVTVADSNQVATLDVTDDGVGFDPAAPEHRTTAGHFGLQGLTDLVAGAGGRFEIRSEPGTGTTMHVEVPLK
ncbi:MAG: sensor histidine kinase [Actinomycetota bacterium]